MVSGSNPKDWKRPEWFETPHNSGDDIAGLVHAVGEDVVDFHIGDRVAALHEMMAAGGGYAEYALAPQFACFHLPNSISFQEVYTSSVTTLLRPSRTGKLMILLQAATIPLAAMTAALALYQRMDLPPPWRPATSPIPLIIYGGSGAVGSFAIKLAQASNIHPIIAIAGNSSKYVETLVNREKGDSIVDYRLGSEAVSTGIKQALDAVGIAKVEYAFDAVTEHGSYEIISSVLAPGGQLALVLPFGDFSGIREDIKTSQSAVSAIFGQGKDVEVGDEDFGFLFFRLFGKGLKDGWLIGHPFEVVPGGLEGVEKGLCNLKAGKNRASKYVFNIGT
jgi:NADPH2:quinone reductase